MSDDEKRMTFTEHLSELRIRIIHSMIAVVVGALICYAFSNTILNWLTAPITTQSEWVKKLLATSGSVDTAALPQNTTMHVFSPMEPVMLKLQVAGYGGLLLVFPYIVYQIGAFIFPGLKPDEKRIGKFILFGGGFLAVAGVMVAYFMVLPFILPFLASWLPPGWQQQFRATETLSTIVILLAGFAIAFQYPMAVLAMVYLNLLSTETLRLYRRPAIVGLTIAAAVLTPPDPFSILFLLTPLVILYEGTIWLSYLMLRKRQTAPSA